MTDVTLSGNVDQFTGTAGNDAVIATDGTRSGADQLQGAGQLEADIIELRNAGNGIVDGQFAGTGGFEILEITDTITATIRLTLGANASAAFAFAGAGGGDPTFAPKAYINASNLTGLQKLILDASAWAEPAGTTDRGLRVSLGQGANDVRLTAFDDRVLVTESSFGANDRIDGGDGFDVLVVQDNAGTTFGDSLFATLTSVEMLRMGNFLPGSPSSGNFRLVLGASSQSAGIERIDSRLNDGQLTINAAARSQSLVIDGATGGDNVLATKGSDIVRGHGGNDELFGNLGNDTLNGGAGADRLDGGAGSDRMIGGAGNDTYFVDNIGDKVIEAATAA
jgi:Ca2+-binding RTX toxin-like protein